eukprot:scaffold18416_cov63-Attheya_sp.AAC.1
MIRICSRRRVDRGEVAATTSPDSKWFEFVRLPKRVQRRWCLFGHIKLLSKRNNRAIRLANFLVTHYPNNSIMLTSTTNKSEPISVEDQVNQLRLSDADLQEEANSARTNPNNNHATTDGTNTNPPVASNSNNNATTTNSFPFRFVPLRLNGNSHAPSAKSVALLTEVGGVEGLQSMTERFYQKAFKDATLDTFIRDHNDPHGRRFATWVHEKLGGPGRLWTKDRAERSHESVEVARGQRVVVHDRTTAHVAAWNSPKRAPRDMGHHFELDEARVWMRLHFWALRDAGLHEISPSFTNYYVRFIGHFMNVYERTAPMFARESFRWSANPQNIQTYLDNNKTMTDVLGLSYRQALRQLPKEEREDSEWPYNDE